MIMCYLVFNTMCYPHKTPIDMELDIKELGPDVLLVAQYKRSWAYSSARDGMVAGALSLLTVGLYYIHCVSYPDTIPGPAWLTSLIVYSPYILATMLNNSCLSHIYGATFLVLVSIWLIIPTNVSVPMVYGLPFGIGFSLLTACCLHLWAVARPGKIDLFWIVRYICVFMTTSYVVANVYGILVSVAIQFFRAPFLLQPISLFGFSSLEAFVFGINCLIAFLAFEWIITKAFPRRVALYLGISLASWCILSGIIWGASSVSETVKVATIGRQEDHNYGKIAREIILKTNAKFVVAPEIKGLGAYMVIGCLQNGYKTNPKCYMSNMAYTINPEGEVVGAYGKMRPTPGEMSCTKNGYFSYPVDTFKFSPLICYDMDYIDPAANAADLGSSLILNPSNDWEQVRHHYAASVIKAVENRVAVVKAESHTDAAIIDPYGRVIALGMRFGSTDLEATVDLVKPFKGNWIRQHFFYWMYIAALAAFIAYDTLLIIGRRKQSM